MNLTTIIGTVGATIILISFILNEIHKLDSESFIYDLSNFVGAILLALYAYILSSIPFLILNVVWALVALRDVVLDIKKK
ncbi:MAG: hypothetical protein Q7S46_04225 [Gallionella sp.]|nr:hypothetical protein [Gallionella sp.]